MSSGQVCRLMLGCSLHQTILLLVQLTDQLCTAAEIFFDPQSHISRGVSWETMLDGFHSAMQVGLEW
jgi:hypothetical protein